MGRKVLQDVANTLPQMLVGWRMGDDMEALAALPDGTLDIDVLAGTAVHTAASLPELRIVGELHAWLIDRLEKAGLPRDQMTDARLVAAICTDRIATDRKRIISFHFTCTCTIATKERAYVGHLAEKHQWHSRPQVAGA
jgi:hypothetical protein